MDELLMALKEVSVVLMPTLGVVALILLSVFLVNLIKVIKNLNGTLTDVDELIKKSDALLNNVDQKVSQLEVPLDTLSNVSKSVDAVNDSAINMVSGIVKQSAQYSDSIVEWFTDKKQKKQEKHDLKEQSKASVEEVTIEEDFGIYE